MVKSLKNEYEKFIKDNPGVNLSYEEYCDIVKDDLKILERAKSILDYSTGRRDDESAKTVLDNEVARGKSNLLPAMVALSNYELDRIKKSLSLGDIVENELFTPTRLQGASNIDLIKILSLLEARFSNAMGRVEKLEQRLNATPVAVSTPTTQYNITQIDVGDSLDRRSRDKIRFFIDYFQNKLTKLSGPVVDAINGNGEDKTSQ